MRTTYWAHWYESDVQPRLAVEQVFADVEFTDLDGPHLRARCPMAPGDRAQAFCVDRYTLRWSCLDHCRIGSQSPLAFLNGGHFPRPGSGEYRAVLEKAASLARVPLPSWPDPSTEEEQRLAQQDRVQSLLEVFYLRTHQLLLDPWEPGLQPSAAEDFLARQGLSREDCARLPLGLATDLDLLRSQLEQSFSPQEIEASELLADRRLAARLVGPIRNPRGQIVSFWARHPLDRGPRFLFKGAWKENAALWGLDAALRSDGQSQGHLVVVERLFDALLLHARGVRFAAAVCGPWKDLSRPRCELLAELPLQRVTLVLDPSANEAELWGLLDHFFHLRTSPEVDLLLPHAFGKSRSLRRFLQDRGPDALRSLLQFETVPACAFRARAILAKHRANGWTDATRHAAWKEAIEFFATAGRRHGPALDKEFVPVIVAGLQRTWDTFQPTEKPEEGSREPASLPSGKNDGFGNDADKPQAPPPAAPRTTAPRSPSLAVPARTIASSPRPAGFCHLHRCPATHCFCFD